MVIKTRTSLAGRVVAEVRTRHPYEGQRCWPRQRLGRLPGVDHGRDAGPPEMIAAGTARGCGLSSAVDALEEIVDQRALLTRRGPLRVARRLLAARARFGRFGAAMASGPETLASRVVIASGPPPGSLEGPSEVSSDGRDRAPARARDWGSRARADAGLGCADRHAAGQGSRGVGTAAGRGGPPRTALGGAQALEGSLLSRARWFPRASGGLRASYRRGRGWRGAGSVHPRRGLGRRGHARPQTCPAWPAAGRAERRPAPRWAAPRSPGRRTPSWPAWSPDPSRRRSRRSSSRRASTRAADRGRARNRAAPASACGAGRARAAAPGLP